MGSPLSQAWASPRAQLLNSSIPAGLQRTGETGRGGGKDERRKRVFSCDTEARINATARKTAYRNGGIGASQPSLKFPLCSKQTAPTSRGEGTRALLLPFHGNRINPWISRKALQLTAVFILQGSTIQHCPLSPMRCEFL